MQAYDKTTYVMTVIDQIRCKRARAMVAEELEQHIADQEEEYLLLGLDKAEAEAEAVRQMGDPVTVGNDLDRIHRPRLDLKLLFMTMLLILAGLIVQYIQAEGGEAEWFIRQLLYT